MQSDNSLQQMGLLNSILLAPEVGEHLWKTSSVLGSSQEGTLQPDHFVKSSLPRMSLILVIMLENKIIHKNSTMASTPEAGFKT